MKRESRNILTKAMLYSVKENIAKASRFKTNFEEIQGCVCEKKRKSRNKPPTKTSQLLSWCIRFTFSHEKYHFSFNN